MGSTSTVRVTVNGKSTELPAGTTVARLLETLGLLPEAVAVERNRELVTRSEHATSELRDGDEVEVVTLVGGG